MREDELFELTKLFGGCLHRVDDLGVIIRTAKRAFQEREMQPSCMQPATNLVRDHANTGTAARSRTTRLA